MRIKVGVMGSAADTLDSSAAALLIGRSEALGRALASIAGVGDNPSNEEPRESGVGFGRNLVLLTGATTGLPHAVGKAATEGGLLHIGISPASDLNSHVRDYGLPAEVCDVLIYTGFGLKGRNVVLVRSCDIVLFISGSIGSLNELTIAHDEGRIIGCLMGTGGVADEAAHLLELFAKQSASRFFQHSEPETLVRMCLGEFLSCRPSPSKLASAKSREQPEG